MKHLLLLLLVMTIATAAEPLTLKIKTDNAGSSASNQFTLPFYSGTTNITIDWGDGTSQVLTTFSRPTHTYTVAGTYTVQISENVAGGFPGISFGYAGDRLKLLELSQWGDVTWRSMEGAFSGCSNMTITATDAATARTGGVSNFFMAWFECTSLTSFPLIDTSSGWTFERAWQHCSGLTSFPLINTAAGFTFYGAWDGCSGLTSFPLINTAAGTSFSYAWRDCSGLTGFPLIDTAAGTYFSSAWSGCSGLTAFPLLDTGEGTDFTYTWFGCSGLTSFPLIDTGKGTDFFRAWYGCSGLTSFPLINTAEGTRFEHTWGSCTGLTSFPLINTAKGTDFRDSWKDCSALVSFPAINTAAGTNFSSAWEGCSGLTSFPLIDTASAKNLSSTWYNCSGLTSFPLINTAAVTNFRDAWYGCSGLTSFPLIDTGAGIDFSSAWSQCRGLTSFPLINTANGTDFFGAWASCIGLTSFPLIDTAKGTDFGLTWTNCGGLTSFPHINTAAGTNFDGTWRTCVGLTTFPTLDLRNMQIGDECFYGVTLTPASYSQLLIALAAQNTNPWVTFHAGSSRYNTSAVSSRSTLTGRGWTITDGGRLTVPTITWPSPATITYGTALSSTQLNASTGVAGVFVFSPVSGTVLDAGSRTLTATFTPTNGATHDVATRSVVLTVGKAPLSVVADSASRLHGTVNPSFTGTLTGVANADNITATYASSATAVTAAGVYLPTSAQAITPTLVDPDTRLGNYTVTSTNGTLTITLVTPVITWGAPTAITYGTALSTTQLNASADVPGSFIYSPAAGTVLHAGAGQTLSVTFTPDDADHVGAIDASQTITVLPAPLTITAEDTTMMRGGSVPTFTAVGSGFVSPDTMAVLDTPPTLSTTATGSSPTGIYPITVSGAVDADYTITFVDGTLTVVPASGSGGGDGGGSSGGKCGMGGGIAALILALMMVMRVGLRSALSSVRNDLHTFRKPGAR